MLDKTLVTVFLLCVAAAVWAVAANPPTGRSCLTRADVINSHNESRQGISLTCNEAIRKANLKAVASP